MNSGVYKITFANGDTYIGKTNDFDRRLKEHCTKMQKGTAAKDMMRAAIASNGNFSFERLIECHPDHIDILEAYYINTEHPTVNTTRTSSIDRYGYSILIRDPDLLDLSTVQHVERIHELNTEAHGYLELLVESDKKIEGLEAFKKELSTSKGLDKYGQTLAAEAVLQNEKDREVISYLKEALSKERNWPWWKRLFGIKPS